MAEQSLRRDWNPRDKAPSWLAAAIQKWDVTTHTHTFVFQSTNVHCTSKGFAAVGALHTHIRGLMLRQPGAHTLCNTVHCVAAGNSRDPGRGFVCTRILLASIQADSLKRHGTFWY